ncbi:MAG: hypothetical protein ACRDTF_00035 [Pseudonocardiaceae bacterium]
MRHLGGAQRWAETIVSTGCLSTPRCGEPYTIGLSSISVFRFLTFIWVIISSFDVHITLVRGAQGVPGSHPEGARSLPSHGGWFR